MTVTPTGAGVEAGDATAPLWRRRRGLTIGILVLVILLVTVLTDLPTDTSRASDISAERSVMTEVNSDLDSCALAIHQAVGIWTLQNAHKLDGGRPVADAGPAG